MQSLESLGQSTQMLFQRSPIPGVPGIYDYLPECQNYSGKLGRLDGGENDICKFPRFCGGHGEFEFLQRCAFGEIQWVKRAAWMGII